MMISARMTRTSTEPIREIQEPSAQRRQTGSRRPFLARMSRSAPRAAIFSIRSAAATLRSASTIIALFIADTRSAA